MTAAKTKEAAGLDLVDLKASYEGREVVHGISFSVAPFEFVTLLGPSGCGKSTTLRCIAGLHRIDSGQVAIGSEIVADGVRHTRPENRHINMVFQSYAIWPHMTVFGNVAYGLRLMKIGKAAIGNRVREMLQLVGLAELADRPATGLSGGQQQRVALARALATEPRILLLDEPLSNLDSLLRARMRAEILRIQHETGTTTLYVTHDRAEALSMSDRIVVLDQGRIGQIGAPAELYDRPTTKFVARFIGDANFVTATVVAVRGKEIEVVAPSLAGTPHFVLTSSHRAVPDVGATIDLVLRPERLVIGREVLSGYNAFSAELASRDFLGSRSDVTFRSGDATLRCEADRDFMARVDGGRTTLYVAPDHVAWVPHDPTIQ